MTTLYCETSKSGRCALTCDFARWINAGYGVSCRYDWDDDSNGKPGPNCPLVEGSISGPTLKFGERVQVEICVKREFTK